MKRYKLIGITGQSGAGKSAVAQVFADNGALVISADRLVSELYTPFSPCLKTLAAQFGADILYENGTLDRALLAERAFASKDNTALLGRLVHPFVTARLFERLRGAQGIVVYDAPQLFESNSDVICDVVIAVVADSGTRLQRITERDGLTPEKARERMNAQYGEDFFRANSDIVIENNGGEAQLAEKARAVFNKLATEVT